MSETMPATGIAGIWAAPGSCARPLRAVLPGSVAELSCQKIIFDLQLADLPVQKIDLGLIAGSLRRTTTLEDACRTVQQLLLPIVDQVRVDPERLSQLGDGPVAPDDGVAHSSLSLADQHIPSGGEGALSRERVVQPVAAAPDPAA